VAEPRSPLHAASDEALTAALRDLAAAVAFPQAAAGAGSPGAEDLATRARRRIVESGIEPRRAGRWPLRRSVVLALAALLVVAAVAAAVVLGLPGLRIVFGPGPSPGPVATATVPTSGPPGATLGLGSAVSLADAERLAGLDVLLPSDPAIGPPDAMYLGPYGRVSLVWRVRPGLPETLSGGIGLLISEFRGSVDEGYVQKVVGSGAQLTRVTVDGGRGFWIDGPPHFFMYVGPDGQMVEDSHRAVGDTLAWTVGGVTYRIESSLGMEDAIRLAESLE
jgi:hypothetical protein